MDETTTKSIDVHEDIAIRLLCGDESVLGDILRRPGYAPAIQEVLCKKYEGYLTYEDIQDVICIAIRKLWDYRESYDESKASVRTLLSCIANNTAQDIQKNGWYKARKMETVLPPNEDDSDPLQQLAQYNRYLGQSSGNDPEIDEKLKHAIEKTLSALRKEFRYILEADAHAGDDGVSQAELARQLNAPVGSVKVWRSRAKEAFRKEMKKLGYDL